MFHAVGRAYNRLDQDFKVRKSRQDYLDSAILTVIERWIRRAGA